MQAETTVRTGGVKRLLPLIALLGICAALTLLMYRMLLTDPQSLRWMTTADGPAEVGPHAFLMDYSIQHGAFPLWNPLKLCGSPYYAHPLRFLYYPPNVVRSLLTFSPSPLRTHVGLTVMMFLHVAATLAAAHAFGRSQGRGRPAAFAGACIYAFGATLVNRLMLGQWYFVWTAAWFPLLMLALKGVLASLSVRESLRYGALGALCWGMLILCGMPQLFATMGFAAALFWLAHRLFHLRQAGAPPLLRRVSLDLLGLALLFGLGTLLASVLLVPGMEFAGLSSRAAGGTEMFRRVNEMPSWNLWQLMVTYSGSRHIEGVRLAGGIALVLGVLGLTHRRWREALPHALVVLILLDISLGAPHPFAVVFARITPFEMSHPMRGAIATCFFLGALAAYGVDTLRDTGAPRWLKRLRAAIAAVAGTAVAAGLYTTCTPHPFVPVPAAVVVALPVAATAVALAAWWRAGRAMTAAAAVLLVVEIVAWNTYHLPWYFTTEHAVYPGDWDYLAKERDFWSDNRRGIVPLGNYNMYDLRPAMNGYDALHLADVRRALCAPEKEGEYDRVVWPEEVTSESERGLLFLKRHFWLAKQWVRGPLPPKDTLWPAATTVFLDAGPDDEHVPELTRQDVLGSAFSSDVDRVTVGGPFPARRKACDDNAYEIVLPEIGLPPGHKALVVRLAVEQPADVVVVFDGLDDGAGIVGRRHRIAPGEHTLQFLMPDCERLTAKLECLFRDDGGGPDLMSAAVVRDRADEDSHIRVLERGANAVTVALQDLPGPRVLAFLDATYPGWKAYVDGTPAPILPANDVFKAVAVPAGSHTVRFVFRPTRLYTGLAITAAALGSVIALLVATRRPRSAPAGSFAAFSAVI